MSHSVDYHRQGDIHTFKTQVPGLETLTVDYTGIPDEERMGLAKQLMASSALACYGAMLGAALDARGAKYTSIAGSATPVLGANEAGQGRVKKLELKFTVCLPEDDRKIFERCVKIMKNGCLVTGSFHEGIEMSYDLQPDYEG